MSWVPDNRDRQITELRAERDHYRREYEMAARRADKSWQDNHVNDRIKHYRGEKRQDRDRIEELEAENEGLRGAIKALERMARSPR